MSETITVRGFEYLIDQTERLVRILPLGLKIKNELAWKRIIFQWNLFINNMSPRLLHLVQFHGINSRRFKHVSMYKEGACNATPRTIRGYDSHENCQRRGQTMLPISTTVSVETVRSWFRLIK